MPRRHFIELTEEQWVSLFTRDELQGIAKSVNCRPARSSVENARRLVNRKTRLWFGEVVVS